MGPTRFAPLPSARRPYCLLVAMQTLASYGAPASDDETSYHNRAAQVRVKLEMYETVTRLFHVPVSYGADLFACATMGELDAVNARYAAHMTLKQN